MGASLYWVEGPWPGNLAVAARPRGGDWLDDEIASWQEAGIEMVLSLLTAKEERELDLASEAAAVRARGMKFISFPIPDQEIPTSATELAAALEAIEANLVAGKNALIHCRQGIGRSGMAAACLLVSKGLSPESAVARVSEARGLKVPETREQRQWIEQYAALLAASK